MTTKAQMRKFIDRAFKQYLKEQTLPYTTIQEYQKVTGLRFRMTKEQKDRGLDRETAFKEFLVNNDV